MSSGSLLKQLSCGIAELVDQGMPAIEPERLSTLLDYVKLLSKWNRVYNLTAVRDPAKMLDRHLLDSLIMSCWLPPIAATRPEAAQSGETRSGETRSDATRSGETRSLVFDVMDIGSGAGLPVLPLAIVRPDLRFLSVESNGKKTRFQQQVLLELGITNVELLNQRVQNVTESAHLVVSRAFTAPREFLTIAYPLCAIEGRVAVMLGAAERMPDNIGPAYVLEVIKKLHMPGADSERHVAVCRRQAG